MDIVKAFLDPFMLRGDTGGFEVSPQQVKPPSTTTQPRDTAPVGSTGAVVWSGYSDQGEIDARLTGSERWRTFNNMLKNVSTVVSAARHLVNMVGDTDFKLEENPEAKDKSGAAIGVEFAASVFADMDIPVRKVARRAAMFKAHGFSVSTWEAKKRDDNKIGFRTVRHVAQRTIDRWAVTAQGDVVGMIQVDPVSFAELPIPRARALYIVDDDMDPQPDGVGLLRQSVDPCERNNELVRYEGVGFATSLAGVPVARVPLEVIAAQRDEAGALLSEADQRKKYEHVELFIKNRVKNPASGLILDSGVYAGTDDAATPSGQKLWDIELLKLEGGTDADAIGKAIERGFRETAMIWGAEWMLLGSERGTQALSKDKTSIWYQNVHSTLMEIADRLRRDLLIPLWKMNGLPLDTCPMIKPNAIHMRDVEASVKAVTDVAAAPLDPDDPFINEVRDLVGMSRIPQEIIDRNREAKEIEQQAQEAAARAGGAGAVVAEQEAELTPQQRAEMKRPPPKPGAPAAKVYTGMGRAVLLRLAAPIAARLKIDGGVEAADMHVTVAYLGDSLTAEQEMAAQVALASWAAASPPIGGVIGGVGRFAGSGAGGRDVLVALVDAPGLPAMRQALVAQLADAGVVVEASHGFTPHITIAYLDPGSPADFALSAPIPIGFGAVYYAAGSVQTEYPLLAGG